MFELGKFGEIGHRIRRGRWSSIVSKIVLGINVAGIHRGFLHDAKIFDYRKIGLKSHNGNLVRKKNNQKLQFVINMVHKTTRLEIKFLKRLSFDKNSICPLKKHPGLNRSFSCEIHQLKICLRPYLANHPLFIIIWQMGQKLINQLQQFTSFLYLSNSEQSIMSVDRKSLNPKRKKTQKQAHEPKTARSPQYKINLDYFSRAIEQSLKKTKPKKKGSRNHSYKSCLSLTKLQRLAQDQNKNILDLLKQKEELIRENEALLFFTKNIDASRESYFLEEIQRKNLEILYIETKMKEGKQKNKAVITNLKKEIKKLQNTLIEESQSPRHHRRQEITPLK